MKKSSLLAVCLILLLACEKTETQKKVLIMGRGQVVAKGNDITMKDGNSYVEETVEIKEDKPVTWNITTPTGKTTVNIPGEKGFYLLNLKTDTIVGSQQNMGDLGGRTMTQEELRSKIDSLVKLTSGANVKPGGNNFFILPNQLAKISSSTNAILVGPFNKIPGSIDADKNGNAPEIFKFYTNTGLRELIGNLKKNTY